MPQNLSRTCFIMRDLSCTPEPSRCSLQVQRPNKKCKKTQSTELIAQAQKRWMFSTEPSCRSGHNVWRDVPQDLWGMLDKFYPTHGCEKLTEMKIPTSIFEDEHPSFKSLSCHKTKILTVAENHLESVDRSIIFQVKDKKAQRERSLYVHFRYWMIGDASTWQAGLLPA